MAATAMKTNISRKNIKWNKNPIFGLDDTANECP